METIRIHPRFDAHYYSFYLEGLRRCFPSHKFRFEPLANEFSTETLKLILPFGEGYKVVICAGDGPELDLDWLFWADCYAKVNLDPAKIPTGCEKKVLSIGPSFGIKHWPLLSAGSLSFLAATRNLPRERAVFRNHFASLWRQCRYRLPERDYAMSKSENDFVFFTGSIWKKEPQINQARANFVRACRIVMEDRFSGGLAPRRRNDVQGFEDVTAKTRYPFRDYMELTRRSAVVFNTPGVLNCLGWKLGEFLALGKAIISLPLTRTTPAPLKHGVHLHVIEPSLEQMQSAVCQLLSDKDYRRHLETNARRYYENHLAPDAVIRRIVAFAQAKDGAAGASVEASARAPASSPA